MRQRYDNVSFQTGSRDFLMTFEDAFHAVPAMDILTRGSELPPFDSRFLSAHDRPLDTDE